MNEWMNECYTEAGRNMLHTALSDKVLDKYGLHEQGKQGEGGMGLGPQVEGGEEG